MIAERNYSLFWPKNCHAAKGQVYCRIQGYLRPLNIKVQVCYLLISRSYGLFEFTCTTIIRVHVYVFRHVFFKRTTSEPHPWSARSIPLYSKMFYTIEIIWPHVQYCTHLIIMVMLLNSRYVFIINLMINPEPSPKYIQIF